MSPKTEHNGISLRAIQVALIVGAVLLSGLMLFSTFRLSASFEQITTASQEQVRLRKAARELMDASDYMTEKVQRFALTGDEQYMHAYINEVLVLDRRDEAMATMSEGGATKAALEKLQAALDASNTLMEQEYYSMCLVMEANGYKNYPIELQRIELSAEDKALRAAEKMELARDLVFNSEYYAQKTQIRENIQASLDALEKLINQTNAQSLAVMKDRLLVVRGMIVFSAVGIFFLVWLASRLGIHPILDAVERIKMDSKIPEAGTSEFRYLVRAYNKMYESYQRSLARLNFKAFHDELTGVYNRAGYESLLDGIDLGSTYMFLFDVDNFKGVNDTYGHEIGDAVLIKLVQTLKRHFRPDDFICRVGGDEFVVLMQHSPQKQESLIAAKIKEINEDLAVSQDGLPATSISVGIVHGSEADKVDELFEKTDVAMYRAKQSGKSTYSFYSE